MYLNKKKPSLAKINDNKLSVTARQMFWPGDRHKTIALQKQQPIKAPIFRKNLRNISSKNIEMKPRMQTETTLGESTIMFQSMYGGKDWLKPSDYIKQMDELNLFGQQKMEVKSYEIKLNDRMQKNLEKYGRLKEVTQKWVSVLKKAISYTTSTKAASDKLIEEVKFWKILSRKFDELEYQFKEEKTIALLNTMKNILKTQAAYRPILEEFIRLKEQIIVLTPKIKRLHLQLEEVVSGFVIKLEQCSDIGQSIGLLKKILFGFDSIYQDNPLLRNRFVIIYEKIDQSMTQKLIATSLYPRQLANISSVKQNYQVLDNSLSFYSNFLNSLQTSSQNQQQLIQKIQYTRSVLANLLQILTYFQHLYNNKQVSQFSKLFSHILNYNIYDRDYREEWEQYMEIVNLSMEKYKFQP